MKLELAHDQLADYFRLPIRWRDRSNADKKRFSAVWDLVCATGAELSVVTRAAVIRTCRDRRDSLKIARDRLAEQAQRGDKSANDACIVLDAELSIIQDGIRTLWKQSGADPPADDS